MLNEILGENLISKICPPTHLDVERIVKDKKHLKEVCQRLKILNKVSEMLEKVGEIFHFLYIS